MTLTTAQRLTALEAAVGDPKLTITASSPLPPQLANGQYNLMYSEFQLHQFANSLVGTAGDDGTGGQIGRIEARLAQLESQVPVPSGSVDVVGALAALNIHVQRNKLAVGMLPLDDKAGLQVGGEADAVVLGMSNVNGTDGQNPGEAHINTLVVADNDGGMRMRQYLQWINGVRTRNTANRAATVVAMDSVGDLCSSRLDIGATSDGGQTWYLITNLAEKFVRFCSFKAGWKVQIREAATQYAATETDAIAAAVDAALKARGL